MRRALERIAVDIARQGRVRVDEPGYVIGERFQGYSGRLAVEQFPLAQIRFQRGGKIGRGAAQSGGDLRLAADARVKDLGLRNCDARADIHLVGPALPIELRGSMLSTRQKIREAEPA